MMLTAFCFFLLIVNVISTGEEPCINDDYECENEYVPIHRFEGDMLGFSNVEESLRLNPASEDIQDNALTDEAKKWPDAIVYYKIPKQFSCSESCTIFEAMHEMEKKTCLNFVQTDSREDYIEILQSDVCASYVGRQGNRQQIFLSSDCATSVGHVIHELMHAIGFFHEQSRQDRDKYINITWGNVAELYHTQFINHGLGNTTTYDLPYDYDSLMHYEPFAFAYNTSIMTVVAKDGRKIGKREHMSDLDIKRINLHYNCTKQTIGCYDTMTDCKTNPNLNISCRVQLFKKKCPKACGLCSNKKQTQQVTNDMKCQKPEDRCKKWMSTTNDCDSNQRNLMHIVKSNCYQTCQNCM